MATQIKHIIFDLDHTLWDYDLNSALTLEQLYHKYDYATSGNSITEFVAAFKVANEHVWDLYSKRQIHKWQLRGRRFELMAAHLGWPEGALSPEFAAEYLALCPTQPHLLDGAEAMLLRLAPHFKLHILTNGFADTQHTKLKSGGIHHLFDVIITSEKLKAAKPHAEIFETLMLEANARPEECLMVGDNPVADVHGAQQVGWWTALYDPSNKYSDAKPDLLITDWGDFGKEQIAQLT